MTSELSFNEFPLERLNGSALAALLKRVWPLIADALDQGATATITEREVRLHGLPIGRSDPG